MNDFIIFVAGLAFCAFCVIILGDNINGGD